jgi:protein SCO1/2
MLRIVFSIISSVGILISCSIKPKEAMLPYYNSPDFTPHFITAQKAASEITHSIADFLCTDQNDSTITQKNVEGKIHIANFFFTACGSICPKMMGNLQTVTEQFKGDSTIVFLSYSVTPWTDSVAKLKRYADNLAAQPNWHLLTGNKAAIYELARKSYFAEENFGYNRDSTEFLHTEHILLVDKRKQIRGIYNGTLELETQQLAKDIAFLKMEN